MQDWRVGAARPDEPARSLIRVLVASHRPWERAGLRALLEREPGMLVVAEAATVPALPSSLFDVAVVALGPGEAPEPGSDESASEIPAVFLGSWSRLTVAALATGPRALLDADADLEEIAAAVRAVATGLAVLGPGAITALRRPERDAPANAIHPESVLTPREIEVLGLIALGLPNKAIAQRLRISEHTAKFHVGSILSKLAAESRTEAVMVAARRGLLAL